MNLWQKIILDVVLLYSIASQCDCKSTNRRTLTKRPSTAQIMKNDTNNSNKETFLTDKDFRNAALFIKENRKNERPISFSMERIKNNNVIRPGMRNMVRNRTRLWPNGTIPYALDHRYNEHQRHWIALAIELFENKTCIRFVPRKPDDKDYIMIEQGKEGEIGSDIGMVGNKQIVEMSGFELGVIQHTLMHTLGFYDEHRRYDRDDHVIVLLENARNTRFFEKISKEEMDTMDFKYDINSIMHPDSFEERKKDPYVYNRFDRDPTILTKEGEIIERKTRMSENDFKRVNKLYKCPRK